MSHAQRAQNPGVCFVRAYAKINLTLDVLERRADGYHALATVMQTVDLYDTLCLTESTDDVVDLHCDQRELSNTQNLAARAALLLRQRMQTRRGVLIELHKRIPVAAGLGGGSSDAAAVLLALQKWWQLPLSSSDLLEIAADLGSDVPFFLSGGLALCEGRGERVTPLVPRWPDSMRWLLLVKPPIAVSTATVFASLPVSAYSDGIHSQVISTALEAGTTLPGEHLHNGLERGVLERYSEVAQARHDLLEAGAPLVRLSGSGPTLFAPFGSLTQAGEVRNRMQARGYEVYLTRAIYPTTGDICSF
ncbi:MAG TPA: 4-(cytidine 5'-diphospho)-2-C-methyl-D-erythritol kinase [Ktedonobacteraceae bacterium]|nr:4-(cytidine 5'-diphospho)-2-C-methyl-D-erythritol kinase [Ktedonobacteraceae bacterium]